MLFYELRSDRKNILSEIVKPSPTKIVKETPLNSTFFWSVTDQFSLPQHKEINSTCRFKSQIEGVDIPEKGFGNVTKDLNDKECSTNSQITLDHVPVIRAPSIPFVAGQIRNSVQTWNHVATSDAVYQRKNFFESQNQKLKRPSKDDIEYDAPKRKGPKHLKSFASGTLR